MHAYSSSWPYCALHCCLLSRKLLSQTFFLIKKPPFARQPLNNTPVLLEPATPSSSWSVATLFLDLSHTDKEAAAGFVHATAAGDTVIITTALSSVALRHYTVDWGRDWSVTTSPRVRVGSTRQTLAISRDGRSLLPTPSCFYGQNSSSPAEG